MHPQQVTTKLSDTSSSREYPPGFTPTEVVDQVRNIPLTKEVMQERNDTNSVCSESKSKSNHSGSFGHFKVSKVPKTGGSILNCMEELVKVGKTMGYNMEGCENDITRIIESQGDGSIHRRILCLLTFKASPKRPKKIG